MLNKAKLCIAAALITACAINSTAQRWQDATVNEVNREARRANFFAFENEDLALRGDKAASARYLSLEGKWRFHFARNCEQAPAGFYGTKYDDSQWDDFTVPAMLELNGYGEPVYKNIGCA